MRIKRQYMSHKDEINITIAYSNQSIINKALLFSKKSTSVHSRSLSWSTQWIGSNFRFIGLTLSSPRRVATHSLEKIEFLSPISSRFFHRVCSGISSAGFGGGGGGGFLTPGASRRVAARRGAARRDAVRRGAVRKGNEREGRFPALRPKSRRSMGSPWRQTSLYLYSPRYFPMKPLGSLLLAGPDRSPAALARLARLAPLLPRRGLLPPWAEGRWIELGRILRGIPPWRAVDFLTMRERGYARPYAATRFTPVTFGMEFVSQIEMKKC